jgi:hypothetical protein
MRKENYRKFPLNGKIKRVFLFPFLLFLPLTHTILEISNPRPHTC